jgi:hypothetical protein
MNFYNLFNIIQPQRTALEGRPEDRNNCDNNFQLQGLNYFWEAICPYSLRHSAQLKNIIFDLIIGRLGKIHQSK